MSTPVLRFPIERARPPKQDSLIARMREPGEEREEDEEALWKPRVCRLARRREIERLRAEEASEEALEPWDERWEESLPRLSWEEAKDMLEWGLW